MVLWRHRGVRLGPERYAFAPSRSPPASRTGRRTFSAPRLCHPDSVFSPRSGWSASPLTSQRLTTELLVALRCVTIVTARPLYASTVPPAMSAAAAPSRSTFVSRDGLVVPYWLVDERARAFGVAFRGGCFCNPGAAEAAFGFDRDAAARCLRAARRAGFSVQRFADCMTRDTDVAVGAMRASLGLANNDADVRRAIRRRRILCRVNGD